MQRGGGTPAQIADQVVKSHPNARMDAGGNLTLPTVDGGAVGQAASPDAAANVIAQQTGVPTVNVLPKEDAVEFEVQINPVARAGIMRAKSPSERAEFKTALGKLDSTAKSTVKSILDERKIRYTRAANWADARAKLETEPAIKAILDKPFNQGNPFGDAAHTEGIKQLNKALVASGSKPLKDVDAGTKISHWKPQVNDEVSPFEGINAALRHQFWDSSTKAQASQAMYTAFDQRLKLGEDEEHDWYRPQNRKEAAIAGGGMRITYTNSKGADFAVTDRFRGSGYKSGANLIATSAHYNDPVMLGAENEIGNFIKNMKATEFEMTVAVKWMDVDTTAAVAKLQEEYPDIVKPKLKAKLQQELTAFVARMKGETPNLKRVKQTKYAVKVKDASGVEKPMDPAPELGMDMWLGMKSAPTG